MCGIVASVSNSGGVSADALLRATQGLRHRGPDAQHVWVPPHARVGLGHVRLSIIDLATGDQPIASEDASLHIVANGEFYGFEAIRAELESQGHTFRTRSDCAIALHLYEDTGARCLHRLRGEFAFALWDERDGPLFAGRDRFGIKPLYYAIHDGACHVASEIKAFPDLGGPLRWDRDTVFDLHRGLMHAPSRSAFEGIHQVPPGCYLITDGARARVLPYWDWDYPTADRTGWDRGPREWVERLQGALEKAVRLRLRADVLVACHLSGGLDSCAVLGLASRLSSRPLRAYTLSFDHADYDERALAEEQATLSGAEFFPIDIRLRAHGRAPLGRRLPRRAPHRERPRRREVPPEPRGARLGGQGRADRRGLRRGPRRVPLLPPGHDPLQHRGPGPRDRQGPALSGLLDDDFRAPYRGRDTFRVVLNHLDVERQLTGRDAVNKALYVWAKTALPNYILSNLGDRMEMAHSVEGRLPLLDHEVVALVAQMPIAMKINGMTEKFVLREAARPVLTDAVYRRQKHPFLSPPSTLQTAGGLHGLIQDTLRGSALGRTGLYDRKRVLSLLDAVPAMDAEALMSVDPALMRITSTCLLHERMGL